jgi:cyanophycin synthetase
MNADMGFENGIEMLNKKRPDESTVEMVEQEMERRGVKVRELKNFSDGKGAILACEFKNHREYTYYSACTKLGYVMDMLFRNKALATHELRLAGFPVPNEVICSESEEAVNFLKKYEKVVIKPIANTGGTGVTPGVKTEEKLRRAIGLARKYNPPEEKSERVVCQQHVEGRDWRVLVIDMKDVFVIERLPAYVDGDGVRSVRELVDRYNGLVKEEVRIRIDDEAVELVTEQGMSMDQVLDRGQKVQLARVANYHSGGRLRDATDEIGDYMINMTRNIAKHFEAPVAGIDILSPDIAGKEGYVIEINSKPDLTIHHFPHFGESRNAVGSFVDMLFPETKDKKD